MSRKVVVHLLILILVSGCVAAPPNPAVIKTEKPGAIMTVFKGTVTAPNQPLIEHIQPKIEEICPSKAKVPINRLGLPDNTGLFAISDSEILGDINHPLRSNILLFSGANPKPIKMGGGYFVG